MTFFSEMECCQDNFLDEVLVTKHPKPPIVVCFYSPRSPRTLNYLDAFHRSLDTFTRMQVSLRFGMLNIVNYPEGIVNYDIYIMSKNNIERRSGLMFTALDSGSSGPGLSPGQGHCVVFLGKDTFK